MNEIVRFFTQVTLLPLTAFVAGMETLARMLRQMQEEMLPGTAAGGGRGAKGPDRDLGGDRVKLVEYAVVAVGRERDEIVAEGQKLVVGAKTAAAFEAEIKKEAPKTARAGELRVYFNVLARYAKPGKAAA